jgi:hypothetical protein
MTEFSRLTFHERQNTNHDEDRSDLESNRYPPLCTGSLHERDPVVYPVTEGDTDDNQDLEQTRDVSSNMSRGNLRYVGRRDG